MRLIDSLESNIRRSYADLAHGELEEELLHRIAETVPERDRWREQIAVSGAAAANR